MNLKEIDLKNIYRQWKKNLGPYRCFFRSTPFVSLQTYYDFEITDCEEEIDNKVLQKIIDEYERGNFVIVDLNFDEILNLALALNNINKIKPVLNINLLFHPFGMVGTNENISRLISYAGKLEKIKTDKYVMLIPYDRYDEKIDYLNIYDKLNNQYSVGFDDLPTSEFLKKLGYEGISIITKNKTKEDLIDYIKHIESDTKVNIVKVGN